MAATFHIDRECGLVRSIAWGRLTLEEVEEHHDTLREHPDFDPDFRHLIDFSAVTVFDLSAHDAKRLTHRPLWSARARQAIAAPDDVAFGMTRLFKARADLPDDAYGVFRTVEEAWRWLGFDGTPPLFPGRSHVDEG